MLGIRGKIGFRLLLSKVPTLTLSSPLPLVDEYLFSSTIKTLNAFLATSISVSYHSDLFFLTMPLLVQATLVADWTGKRFKVSSEPPAQGRRKFGDEAVYEIVENAFAGVLRVIVELRSDYGPNPLRSILEHAYEALKTKHATSLLVLAVPVDQPVKLVEVKMEEERLKMVGMMELNLQKVNPKRMDEESVRLLIQMVGGWLKERQDSSIPDVPTTCASQVYPLSPPPV